jgi:nitrate/nitrite transporter NarK
MGWGRLEILASLILGAAFVVAFVCWELRAQAPMLPMRFFRNRTFAATNAASLFMFFGMFGSIFLLAQFLQTVQGYSPLSAGLRTLPWTAMPIFVAPIAGALSDRIGGRPLMAVGLAMQAIGLGWLATISSPTVPYGDLVPAFVVSGIGMALFFAPVANVVLSSVRREEEGKASGTNNAIRELGGVFGVAVLASVFSRYGGYESPATFVDGLVPAVWVGAAVVATGALAALFVPRRRRSEVVVPVDRPEAVEQAA